MAVAIPSNMKIVCGKPAELLGAARKRNRFIASNALVDHLIQEKPEVLRQLIDQFATDPYNIKKELNSPGRRIQYDHPERPEYWHRLVSQLMTSTVVAYEEGVGCWTCKDTGTNWIISKLDGSNLIRYGTIWVCEQSDYIITIGNSGKKIIIEPSKVDVYLFGEGTHVLGEWYLLEWVHMLPLGERVDGSDPDARRLAFGEERVVPQIRIVYRTINGTKAESGR